MTGLLIDVVYTELFNLIAEWFVQVIRLLLRRIAPASWSSIDRHSTLDLGVGLVWFFQACMVRVRLKIISNL